MSNLFKKKVAIYCCAYTDKEAGGSFDTDHDIILHQKESLRQFATQNGWQIYDFYIDTHPNVDAPSADCAFPSLIRRSDDATAILEHLTASRPAFNRLYLDAKAHLFDIVLCQSLSCLTHNPEFQTLIIEEEFTKWGIRFLGISDFSEKTSYVHMTEAVPITTNANPTKNEFLYTARQNERLKKCFLSDINCSSLPAKSTSMQTSIPFGYRFHSKNTKKLLKDEPAAKIVCFIYNAFSEGLSIREITSCLRETHIPAPNIYQIQDTRLTASGFSHNCDWQEYTVLSILKNEFYHGSRNTEYIFSPIISEALWKCVQNQLNYASESLCI